MGRVPLHGLVSSTLPGAWEAPGTKVCKLEASKEVVSPANLSGKGQALSSLQSCLSDSLCTGRIKRSPFERGGGGTHSGHLPGPQRGQCDGSTLLLGATSLPPQWSLLFLPLLRSAVHRLPCNAKLILRQARLPWSSLAGALRKSWHSSAAGALASPHGLSMPT